MMRAGIKLLVEAQADMEVVGEAGDGRTAIELAQQLKPDVVLMDISMPELNGLKATAKLKRILPEIKILTLTRHTDDAYLQELLRAGVSGYVLKQSAPTELISAIQAVAAGKGYLDPKLLAKFSRALVKKEVS
jgi:two-component system response regulator NreC